jgi:LPXTG-site transpeptidase (sortase) family protein
MDISRRTAIKSVVGAAVAGVAATQVAVGGADAATLGTISIPRIGVRKSIYSGTTNTVLNRGGFGHWVGSAKPGKVGHSILFAHRTSAGGPLRKAHLLKVGDKFTAGGVVYTVRAKQIVGSKEKKKALNYGSAGKRMSLITCTKPNGQPTSTKYRLIIRATA